MLLFENSKQTGGAVPRAFWQLKEQNLFRLFCLARDFMFAVVEFLVSPMQSSDKTLCKSQEKNVSGKRSWCSVSLFHSGSFSGMSCGTRA